MLDEPAGRRLLAKLGIDAGPWKLVGHANEVAVATRLAGPARPISFHHISFTNSDAGVELLIGATRDPILGPIVAFGGGGVGAGAEVDRDITFRAASLTHARSNEIIDETMVSAKPGGYRRLPLIDCAVLADLLARIGQIVSAPPWIHELGLDPVIASGSGTIPADVQVILSNNSYGGTN